MSFDLIVKKPYVRRVQYYETDCMGIVHHSNYIRWFEEARTEFMRDNGIDYADIEAQGVLMPVTEVSSEFKNVVKYGDTVEIHTKVRAYNGVRLSYEYEVYLEGTDVLMTKGVSGHCFIDAEKRSPINMKKRLPVENELMMRLAEG